jgi:hypothetical protein
MKFLSSLTPHTNLEDAEGSTSPMVILSVSEITKTVWQKRWLFAWLVLTGFFFGVLYNHVVQPVYQSTMVVSAHIQEFKTDLGGETSLGGAGISSLIGLASGKEEHISPFARYRFLVNSHTAAEALAKNHHALQIIFANLWDPKTQSWQRPYSILNPLKDAIKSLLGLPKWQPPTAENLHGFLNSNFSFTQESINGAYRLKLRYNNPQIALDLLKVIHQVTNKIITDADLNRTVKEIAVLEKQLGQVNQMETRTALGIVLARRIEAQTVLSADLSYSASILESPIVSNTPIWPKPILSIIFSIIFFVILGLLYIILARTELARRLLQSKR